jgi:hypothetical protein
LVSWTLTFSAWNLSCADSRGGNYEINKKHPVWRIGNWRRVWRRTRKSWFGFRNRFRRRVAKRQWFWFCFCFCERRCWRICIDRFYWNPSTYGCEDNHFAQRGWVVYSLLDQQHGKFVQLVNRRAAWWRFLAAFWWLESGVSKTPTIASLAEIVCGRIYHWSN